MESGDPRTGGRHPQSGWGRMIVEMRTMTQAAKLAAATGGRQLPGDPDRSGASRLTRRVAGQTSRPTCGFPPIQGGPAGCGPSAVYHRRDATGTRSANHHCAGGWAAAGQGEHPPGAAAFGIRASAHSEHDALAAVGPVVRLDQLRAAHPHDRMHGGTAGGAGRGRPGNAHWPRSAQSTPPPAWKH